MLTPKDIAAMLDHSTLQPFLTDADIQRGCEIALKYHTASVCARPQDMALVSRILRDSGIKACTVIGFPHGAHRTDVKVYEAERALDDGCQELDMVMAIGKLKSGALEAVEADIRAVCQAAHQRGALVKVILETCYLSPDEIVRACALSEKAGCDFVKTSTGYGAYGARPEDVSLMRKSVSPRVRVKASGGIRDLDGFLSMYQAGADRAGVSATEAIMQEAERRFREGILEPSCIVK